MNREEFKQFVISKIPKYKNMGFLEDEEPFWIPEFRDGWKASYFAETKVMQNASGIGKREFWEWCKNNLSKNPLCFMNDTSRNVELWGFNTEQDLILFLLRWS